MAPSSAFNFELTPQRVKSLVVMLDDSRQYVQRFVEQASFVAAGGQRWRRDFQILIPSPEESSGEEVGDRDWRIVPLGQFWRRRLADIVVEDASGDRLNLLTRKQHGDGLTMVTTRNYLFRLLGKEALRSEQIARFRWNLFRFFTSHGILGTSNSDIRDLADVIEQEYELLVDLPSAKRYIQCADFRKHLTPWIDKTQYLCWVHAAPGEVINLHVTYTVSDPNHELDIRTWRGALGDFIQGLPVGRTRVEAEASRRTWFRPFGLAPIDYQFKAPGRPGVGSYYFTLEPPPYTSVTYLDWEAGHHFHQAHSADEQLEVNCALPAAHIHSTTATQPGEASAPKEATTIRAYVRCAPYRHKQILGVAAVNLALVWLLANGELPGEASDPLQGLIFAAPSVVIGYLAQQQRHYYAQVVRRQRGLLWTYLAFSVCFLITVAFNERDHGWIWKLLGTGSAYALGVSSAGLIAWHFPLGGFYERGVRYFAKKSERQAREECQVPRPMWEYYGEAVRTYGARVVQVSVGAMVLVLAAMVLWWHGSWDSAASREVRGARLSVHINLTAPDRHTDALPTPQQQTPGTNQPPDASGPQSSK